MGKGSVSNWEPKGWKEWSIVPSGSECPPIDAEEVDGLNFMGDLGWELAHVESIWDFPPGISFQNQGGAHARLTYSNVSVRIRSADAANSGRVLRDSGWT
jgi:hypothetical protein